MAFDGRELYDRLWLTTNRQMGEELRLNKHVEVNRGCPSCGGSHEIQCRQRLREQGTRMTREEYGSAYQQGLNMTVRFLMSRGLTYDGASEIGQAAWVRGWERLEQLRDASTVLNWMNSIALNLHRAKIRREPLLQRLPELPVQPKINLAAIDSRRILETCKNNDRMVLQRYYLEDFTIQDIAGSRAVPRRLSVSVWSERGVLPANAQCEVPAAHLDLSPIHFSGSSVLLKP